MRINGLLRSREGYDDDFATINRNFNETISVSIFKKQTLNRVNETKF